MGIWQRLGSALADKRVVPDMPDWAAPRLADAIEQEADATERDRSSSWSVYIEYGDAEGVATSRRITCTRLEGESRPDGVRAFCHERRAMRLFKIDRIVRLHDLSAADGRGVEVDPMHYFAELARRGIPIEDRVLTSFAKLLVFIMRCDGRTCEQEWAALEHALARYVLRFGGNDRSIEKAMDSCRSIAPDGVDAVRTIKAIGRAANRRAVAALAIESCAAVIDADGRIAEEETYWGTQLGDVLKKIAA